MLRAIVYLSCWDGIVRYKSSAGLGTVWIFVLSDVRGWCFPKIPYDPFMFTSKMCFFEKCFKTCIFIIDNNQDFSIMKFWKNCKIC